MTVLVTGSAGFIGYHVCEALLGRGARVLGVDDLNAYYDPALKRARLARLAGRPGFTFAEADIADPDAMTALVGGAPTITKVVHLAAQAGVRYSIERPFAYLHSNLAGHLVILELCRHALPRLEHLVYASSSSVYGGNTKIPFAETDPVNLPVSLYAATKRADELISHTYSHLYGIPATGLRFFTVYGPWGRPDMAYYSFTDAIARGRPITLYNHGEMARDFTYVDDAVAGVLAALDRPPVSDGGARHRIYNLGNNEPVTLRHFVRVLEQALNRAALIELAPLPQGDMLRTYADIEASRRDLGFSPTTSLDDGLQRFVAWYKLYQRGE